MLLQLTKRLLLETDPRLLAKFAWNFGAKSLVGMWRFNRRLKRGGNFPAVLFISVTSACNLRCQGCWVSVDGPTQSMPPAELDRIITRAKRGGVHFFGILGGEPLMYGPLWKVLGRHLDCYFQLLTNGTLLDTDAARTMRRLGNVTPLVSIEGLAETSDVRRGGSGVYDRSMAAIDLCRRNGLVTGVATSVCKSNIDELVTEQFVQQLIRRGVHYVWYYIYRPAGPDPMPELALSADEILRLRRFIVETRRWAPIIIVDAYWDDAGRALCPAAAAVSYHINPTGHVEPCPPIQFAAETATNGQDVFETIEGSQFIRRFRKLAAETSRGCILLERPDLLRDFMIEQGATDTSGRGTGLAELAAARSHPSHDAPGQEIPEQQWMYRFAKKHWFFGFGAYG